MKIPTEASRRVARSLLVAGPATAPELADRLAMTPAGVRRHLDSLLADGFIEAGERPAFGPTPTRGRGRPPRIYSIADSGRDFFDQGYDDLAVSALRFLRDSGGGAAVARFADRRAAEMEQRYLPLLRDADTVPQRAQRLAAALAGDGFAASVAPPQSADAGVPLQICQHNCPVAHVAEEFPELCAAETSAFSRLLGTNVTRLATIAHGDGICTAVITGVGGERSSAASTPDTSSFRRPVERIGS